MSKHAVKIRVVGWSINHTLADVLVVPQGAEVPTNLEEYAALAGKPEMTNLPPEVKCYSIRKINYHRGSVICGWKAPKAPKAPKP